MKWIAQNQKSPTVLNELNYLFVLLALPADKIVTVAVDVDVVGVDVIAVDVVVAVIATMMLVWQLNG